MKKKVPCLHPKPGVALRGLISCRLLVLAAGLFLPHQVVAEAPVSRGGGSGPIGFFGPDNLVFDDQGSAYVVDNDHQAHGRVVKVSAAGGFIGAWNVFDHGAGAERGPEGIALDARGRVFVVDLGWQQVRVFSADGQLLSSLGDTSLPFDHPGHVAVAADGTVYVSEASHNRIHRLPARGKTGAIWQRPVGSGPGEWNRPESIAVLRDGSLVVEDWANRRIEILSPTGATRLVFGGPGRGPGQFANSAGLFVDGQDNILVADQALHRIQKFDSGGKLVGIISNTADSMLFENGPTSVSVDAGGNIYAADGLTIVKLSPQGALLARWK
jgi:sugar lactone lactonase YvrE